MLAPLQLVQKKERGKSSRSKKGIKVTQRRLSRHELFMAKKGARVGGVGG